MDGWRRKVVVRNKVNGYRHRVSIDGIHTFRRGNIGYILSNVDDKATIEKVDYASWGLMEVEFDDFYKFADIQKVESVINIPGNKMIEDSRVYQDFLVIIADRKENDKPLKAKTVNRYT